MSNLYPDLNNSQFPDAVDKFTQFMDILASDGELIKQYQEAIKSGNQILANTVLNLIPSYKQKIVTAEDLNKFSDAITALERFYKTDIIPYTNQKQAEWQGIIDQFSYAEEFDENKQYSKNNYVSYGVGSSNYLYIAIDNPPLGTLPTNVYHWRQLTVQGKTGPTGENVSFVGTWDGGRQYVVNNVVEYLGGLWNAIRPNTNSEPNESSADWELVCRIGNKVYPITARQPSGQRNNELWFKVLE